MRGLERLKTECLPSIHMQWLQFSSLDILTGHLRSQTERSIQSKPASNCFHFQEWTILGGHDIQGEDDCSVSLHTSPSSSSSKAGLLGIMPKAKAEAAKIRAVHT